MEMTEKPGLNNEGCAGARTRPSQERLMRTACHSSARRIFRHVRFALLGTAGHYALLQALNHADASAIQPFGYFLLVWATVLGGLFFDQFPDAWTLLGAGIIILSGLYAWVQERRRDAGAR